MINKTSSTRQGSNKFQTAATEMAGLSRYTDETPRMRKIKDVALFSVCVLVIVLATVHLALAYYDHAQRHRSPNAPDETSSHDPIKTSQQTR